MAKAIKTNAMRLLEQSKMEYQSFNYAVDDDSTDGTLVARMNDRDTGIVHKTLVAQGVSKSIYVFVIPISKELDLKKAAKVAGEKKVEMLPHKDLLKYTGYIKGGCSPIGMKKLYSTFVSDYLVDKEYLIVSAGKRGYIIEISFKNLIKIIQGSLVDIVK